MEQCNYTEKIKKIINKSKVGTVFVSVDFAHIADNRTICVVLSRLERDGLIERLLRGVYYKPEYSKFLKENIAPDPNDVAKAIARSTSSIIVPTGDTVLNMFGLSTQIVGKYIYVTNGKYKTYQYGNVTIIFKRTTNKELINLSERTAMLVQAIKSLGKENIGERELEVFSSKYNDEEKRKMIDETRAVTSWIYEIVKDICGGINKCVK